MQSIIRIGTHQVPWLSLSSKNSTRGAIHFSPANGFPSATYLEFLSILSKRYPITAMDCRGSWPDQESPEKQFDMANFANDLINGIEAKHTRPVIGMGHSLGGHITAVAALKRPDLFSALVLIEPASIPFRALDFVYPHLPRMLIYRLLPFVKGSKRRQRIWASRDDFRDRYQTHPLFKRFSSESLENYVQYGLQTDGLGRYELAFSPTWEAHIFCKMEFLWKHLRKLSVPTLIISAEHSNLYSPTRFNALNEGLGSHIQAQTLPNTHHLLPLESPELLAATMSSWLDTR